MAEGVYDPFENSAAFGPGTTANGPSSYDPLASSTPMAKPPLLSTSHETLPSDTRMGRIWNQGVDAVNAVTGAVSDFNQGADAARSRIVDAGIQGWKDTPSFWTPAGRAALDRPLEGAPPAVQSLLNPTVAGVTRGIIEPAGNLMSGAFGAGAAGFRGLQQALMELGTAAGTPFLGSDSAKRLGRDLAAMPEAFAGDSSLVRPQEAPKYQGANTMVGADTVASNIFRIADRDNTVLSPDLINRSLDLANPSTPRQLAKQATTGKTVVTDQLERLEQFRDQPMTVQQWQGVNEGLTAAIKGQYGVNGLSPEGAQLMQIQHTLRDQIQNATKEDLVSGTGAGLAAIKEGNAAYAQARKMEAVETMQRNAEPPLTDNPAQAIRQQVRAFLKNDAKTRGWSEDEIAALKEAADRGSLGNVAHILGNRFGPAIATVATPIAATLVRGEPSITNMLMGPAAGLATHYMGMPFRAAENIIHRQRLSNALDVLGQRVPPNPFGLPEPP